MVWYRSARSTVSWGSVVVVLPVGWSVLGAVTTLRRPSKSLLPLRWSTMAGTGTGRKAAVTAVPKMIVPRITAAKMPIIIRSVLLEGLQLASSVLPWGRTVLVTMSSNPFRTEVSSRCAFLAGCASWF